ncbi:MAG: hypothetical protein ACI8RA_003149, partial [Chlamydiales bacterium]
DEEELSRRLIDKMHRVTFEGTDQKIFTTSTILGLIFFSPWPCSVFPP